MFEQLALGDFLTVASMIVLITMYIVNTRTQSKVLDTRLSMIDASMEDFRNEMKEMQNIVSIQAVQDVRLNSMDERILAEGKRLDRFEEKLDRMNR